MPTNLQYKFIQFLETLLDMPICLVATVEHPKLGRTKIVCRYENRKARTVCKRRTRNSHAYL
ncbi:MAG: hypothetical protein AMXMBFR84_16750 [Candidatus Hydrogenedentota bacterium]